jgi:hypothetical protein
VPVRLTGFAAALALIAGATYTGTHAGGGRVAFTVAEDGSRLTSYSVGDVRGDTCTFVAGGTEQEWEGVALANGAFEYRLHDAILFRGTLPDGSAAGTLRLFNGAVRGVKPACDTGEVGWTAQPSGSLPTAGTADGAAATFRTNVTLRRGGRAGRVRSLHRDCRAGRRVTLERRGRKVGTAITSIDGSFRLERTARTRGRRVRVVVKKREVAAATCAPGRSKAVRG